MGNRNKIFNKLVGIFIACVLGVLPFNKSISAYSDSNKANLPGTKNYIQSNVWQSFTAFYQTHSFKVSAKCFTSKECKKQTKAKTIKTSFSFVPTGIGVSCTGVSVGNISGNGFSGSYENTNASISDISGTFKIKGAPLYSTFSNSAYALKDGVKAITVAEVFRFY